MMSDYFDRIERQMVRRVEEGMPRATRRPSAGGYLAVAAAVLVVIIVAGVFLLARGSGGGGANPSPPAAAGARVVFSVSGDASPAVVERSAKILRERLHAAVPGAQVSVINRRIVVTPPNSNAGVRSRILALAAPGVLTFYDWEGQVLAPNGKSVASELPSPTPAVMEISQGSGSAAPGQVGAGCVSLKQALALARKAGAGRPRTTEYLGRLRLSVPIGYTVLQAASTGPGQSSDGYFIVRGFPGLFSTDLTNPKASTDPNSRIPDVQFGLTAEGRRGFEAVTRSVARRGAQVSSPGQTLTQHFAIALDNRVISVPFIDYRQYPDGVPGDNGADISGNFTTRSARDLAILLRYGSLPVILRAAG
jgi:SecD/SecF fusion protein